MKVRLLKSRPKPAKKSEWMKGFSCAKRMTDAELVQFESIRRMKDWEHKRCKKR